MNPTLSLSILLNKVTGQLVVTQNTTFGDLDADAAGDVVGSLYIKGPAGDIYINDNFSDPTDTPDIDLAVSNEFSTDLPQTTDGQVIQGDYEVQYKVNIATGPKAGLYTYSFKAQVKYDKPCIKIKQDIDCFCASFTSTDTTNYGDSTKEEYAHKIYYPAPTGEAPIETTLASYKDSRLANGTYTSEVITQRSWTFGSFTVLEELVGRKDIQVDCTGICEIKCGMANLYDKWLRRVSSNKLEADALLKKLNQVTALATLLNWNKSCGKVDKANTYMTSIKEILGDCDCGCTECGDEELWITNVCGLTNDTVPTTYIFQKTGPLLTVATQVTGENEKTVTYGLSIQTIAAALMADLDPTLIGLEETANFWEMMTEILTILGDLQGATFNAFAGVDTACFGLDDPTSAQKMQFIVDAVCALTGADFSRLTAETAISDKIQAIIDALCLVKENALVNDLATTPVNTAVNIPVVINDTIVVAPYSLTILTAPVNGSAVVELDNSITYTPDTDFVGVDTITYKVTDANGDEKTAVVTITVTAAAVNCPTPTPIFSADVSLNLAETHVTLSLVNETDYNDGCPTSTKYYLAFYNTSNQVVLQPAAITGNNDSTPTVVSVPYNAAFSYVKVTMQITTQDCDTGTTCGSVNVTNPNYDIPEPVNTPPAANDDTYTTDQDVILVINNPAQGLLSNDTDLDNDSLTATAGTFATTGGGSVTINANGTFTYTPANGWSGTDSFNYTLSDGTDTDTGTAYITVLPEYGVPGELDISFTGTTIDLCSQVSGNGKLIVTANIVSSGTDLLSVDGVVSVTIGTPQAVNTLKLVTYTPPEVAYTDTIDLLSGQKTALINEADNYVIVTVKYTDINNFAHFMQMTVVPSNALFDDTDDCENGLVPTMEESEDG